MSSPQSLSPWLPQPSKHLSLPDEHSSPNHMGRKKKEVKGNDPRQHQSLTVKTAMLDPFLAWSYLQQNTIAASLPVFT